MSAKLFSLFVKTFKRSLPRHPVRTGLQIRHITFLDMATIETTEDKQEQAIINNKNLTRFKKRFMKRQWEDSEPNSKENGGTEPKKACDRIKRKKMAMLLGYCGVDYYGMQRNPGVPTIEEDLLKALYEAKYITEDDFNNQQGAQFQRSSRTDKGVSAAKQVVSLKLPLEVDIEEINKRLPETIKVFGVKRVTNRFNSKSKCNARTYSYTLPTYVFEPSLVDEQERKLYRISAEKLQKVNEVLAVYKGTKSYHNFTEKKHFHDPSALRYMMSFGIEKTFVHSDMEFAVLLVKAILFDTGEESGIINGYAFHTTYNACKETHLNCYYEQGQSFMLHQIRKMVGLMIAIIRGHVDYSILDKVFGKDKVMIPTAPGLGLVLDTVHYERYDAKFKNSHDSLTWDDLQDTIQKFKHEQIYPNIVKGEFEGNMSNWLKKLDLHSYEPSEENEKQDGAGDEVNDDDDDERDSDDENESEERKNENNRGETVKNETSPSVTPKNETNSNETGESHKSSETSINDIGLSESGNESSNNPNERLTIENESNKRA